MEYDGVSFHNVAALHETDVGVVPQRVPEETRRALNDDSARRMRIPAGVELRFVADSDDVTVTLSCPDGETTVRPFWGPFQAHEPIRFGPEPERIHLEYPQTLTGIDDRPGPTPSFSTTVWRLRLQYDAPGPVHYHGIDGGGIRPPRPDECPTGRYLAYGTSITEGFHASSDHLTYPAIVARRTGYDPYNLGSAGSAYCERALADYFATEAEWDLATVALSSNMMNAGFSLEEFENRTRYMLRSLADARPDCPVVAITLFRRYWDLDRSVDRPEWRGTPAAFRASLHRVAATLDRDNLFVLEGTDLLRDPGGHTADVVHPGDYGMLEIGSRLATELRAIEANR